MQRLQRHDGLPARAAGGMPQDLDRLAACLRPADVLLVEGVSRFSAGIKYLTQSTWSHAALYVGDALRDRAAGDAAGAGRTAGGPACFVPRDFDVSPYFEVVKPTLAGGGFDHQRLNWADRPARKEGIA